jgi:hypothetical protein
MRLRVKAKRFPKEPQCVLPYHRADANANGNALGLPFMEVSGFDNKSITWLEQMALGQEMGDRGSKANLRRI